MTVAIVHQNGAVYYTDAESLLDVKRRIEREDAIPCWWVSSGASATRYDEDCLFLLDTIALIRTEGDDD